MRELKAAVVGLQKQIDQRFNAQQKQLDQRFEVTGSVWPLPGTKERGSIQALMAAFGEFKAQSELTTIRVISQLSERIAVLEASR